MISTHAAPVPGFARSSRRPSGSTRIRSWRTVPASARLLVIGVCVALVAAGALGSFLWELRQNALTDTRQNLRVLGLAIAEQTSRSVQAGQMVLEDLRHSVAQQAPRTVAEFKAQQSTRSVFSFLQDRADVLPQVDAFMVIAADGSLVNTSRQWPPPALDLSDRDYLTYFRDHDTAEAYISAPVRNRMTGAWNSFLVRRIDAPSGEFLGMVLAAVNLDYFQEFYHALTANAGLTVTLWCANGTMLTSYPPITRPGEPFQVSQAWHDIVQHGGGVVDSLNALEPGQRMVSVNPVNGDPLVVDVSIARGAALADWKYISATAAICFALALVCGTVLVRLQFIQYKKLERSERLLAHRNAVLQDRRRALRSQAVELSTSRSRMEEQSATLAAALRHLNQGILMVDAERRVVVCNERAVTMLDLPPDLLAVHPKFDDLIAYQKDNGEFADPSSITRSGSFERAVTNSATYERVRPNGTILEVQTVLTPEGGLVRTYTDITARRRSEEQVKFLAHHDALTGLSNRNAFRDKLDALIADPTGRGQRLALYYLDLDGFKHVNDTHGHAIGDQLLQAVAQRLKAAVHERDVVARMGGDEFSILQTFDADAQVAERASELLLSIDKPFQIAGIRCAVGLSIGVALYPDHAEQPEALLQNADTALYRAKAGGRGVFRLFDPAMDQEVQTGNALRRDLALALANDQLHLEYQPIVEAGSLAVVRFEALLRWTHPTHGRISPATFIPIAEQSGLIVPIGLWVLETACAAAATWPAGVEVSVNLSPIQFAGGDLPHQVEQALRRTGLRPSQLNIEITEGVLLENTDAVLDAMARLREHGIRFSLDDFGTEHAGLTYLRRFPFDVLKIDKSFVHGAAQSRQARALLGAIQAVGEACNLQVVAEGVETEAELEIVRALHCEHVQGYLTGRPGPAPAFDAN